MKKLLPLLLLVLASCSKEHNPGEPPGPRDPAPIHQPSTAEACAAFIKSLPSDVVRDYVDVPEDAANPAGPHVRVFYYGKIVVGTEPTLFINGGPGEDSHGEYKLLKLSARADPLWNKASVLFFDQRGNGCSSGYPQGKTDEVLARLRFYGSSGIVADAEAIRKKLFPGQKWRVIGQSYGGWVAHRYAIQAPEALSLVAAHANVIDADPLERVTNRIYSQHRVLEEYLKTYPDDRARLDSLHAMLTLEKKYPSTPAMHGLGVLTPFVTEYLPFVPKWTRMHDYLSTMVRNNEVDDCEVLRFLRENVAPSDPTNLKGWAKIVIAYYDRNVPEFDRPTCDAIYARLRTRGEAPESYLLDECLAPMQDPLSNFPRDRDASLARLSAAHGLDHLTIDQFKNALAANPAMKFFLYSGQLDPMVPVENFAAEVAAVGPLVTYRNFARSGHDGYYSEHQVALDVLP